MNEQRIDQVGNVPAKKLDTDKKQQSIAQGKQNKLSDISSFRGNTEKKGRDKNTKK